jgi:hypothetical protein
VSSDSTVSGKKTEDHVSAEFEAFLSIYLYIATCHTKIIE